MPVPKKSSSQTTESLKTHMPVHINEGTKPEYRLEPTCLWTKAEPPIHKIAYNPHETAIQQPKTSEHT